MRVLILQYLKKILSEDYSKKFIQFFYEKGLEKEKILEIYYFFIGFFYNEEISLTKEQQGKVMILSHYGFLNKIKLLQKGKIRGLRVKCINDEIN